MAAPKGNKYAEGNKGGGRKSMYTAEHLKIASAMAKLGAIDKEIAEELEVSITTLNAWKAKHQEFAEALKKGKEKADDRVEHALYHRALGYSHDAVKIMQFQGEPVVVDYVEHVPPDTTAAIFWLKNRRPENWRANPEQGEGESDRLAAALESLVDRLPGA